MADNWLNEVPIRESEDDYTESDTIIITPDMGGQCEDMLNKVISSRIKCYGPCNAEYTITQLKADIHMNGLRDARGNRWWIYSHCPSCGYDMSWQKIIDQLKIKLIP